MESFAIVIENVQAICIMRDDAEPEELSRGAMVEIRKGQDRNNYSNIIIHNYYQNHHMFENILFKCKSSALLKVPLDVWPHLIAVADPIERVNIAKDKSYIDFIRSIGLDSFVTVNGQFFSYITINQTLKFL